MRLDGLKGRVPGQIYVHGLGWGEGTWAGGHTNRNEWTGGGGAVDHRMGTNIEDCAHCGCTAGKKGVGKEVWAVPEHALPLIGVTDQRQKVL